MKKMIGLICIFVLSGTINLEAKNISINYKNEIFFNNNQFSLMSLLEEEYSELSTDISKDFHVEYDKEEEFLVELFGGKFFIGYIKENEQNLTSNDETLSFFIEDQQENDGYSQEQYNIELKSISQLLGGVIIGGKILSSDKTSLTINSKILEGLELIWRDYTGEINAKQDQKDYYASGTKRFINTNLNQEMSLADKFDSSGYSLGGSFKWEIKDNLELNLVAENIYSKIKWNNVYTESQSLNEIIIKENNVRVSNINFPYDKDERRWGCEDYITELTPEYDLFLTSHRSQLGIFYREEVYPYFNYKLLVKPIMIKTGFYGEFLSLALAYKGLNLNLKTKNIDLFSSSGVLVDLSFKIEFWNKEKKL
ncbi:hypothetical protein BX659_10267 [Orenia metallireducens]|uniref:DUF5723 domain-containing protein n=1 Tax=Orenia metallireducens TaxID=1413210 RepID=A0A285F529_9FIRM|nr:hypothetical protein [Orenia metallireducens]PRX34752.1 hypothetical protein BX659_10267 [Orenia metallireducens]SNY05486.1 hypothetical protein SAMN06265827_10167 [Orenia metallireducens]